MKLVRRLSFAFVLVTATAPGWAAQHDHTHAQPAASSASTVASKPMLGEMNSDMVRMANQTKAMQAMHDKMMAAKTPDERQALMADHMRTMQEGMGMMKGIGGMSGMAGSKNPSTNMTERQTMMEKRMDMMQTMLEMMVDRLPQAPTKP